MTIDSIYDVVIIGGGPAGLSCALYSSRAKLSTIVLDRAAGAGALAATGKIANYPGVRGVIPGSELLDIMRGQALDFGAEYTRASVMAADLVSDPKIIYTSEQIYSAKAVVIATGSMGRSERIEGEEEFIGRGVSYCVTCDAAFFTDQTAALVGYDEAAVEEALFLARFAKEVHLISPRSHFKAPIELLDEVTAAPNISIHLNIKPVRVVGEQFVTGLTVKNGGGIETIMPVSGVFMLLTGNAPVTDFLGGSVKVKEEGCIDVDYNLATNIPGVYAVGDVTCLHPKQAIIAAGEGAVAALAIDKYLSSRERAKVDYM